MNIGVIGANGLLGQAISHELRSNNFLIFPIGRDYVFENLPRLDLLINVAGNSRKYLAETNPVFDFQENTNYLYKLLSTPNINIGKFIHISSSEVYGKMNPFETKKSEGDRPSPDSNYGFSKLLAEQIVQNFSKSWIVFRLGGLFGQGMKKGPVFDISHGSKLRLTGDSTLQLMNASNVAKKILSVSCENWENEIYNLASPDCLTIRQIGQILNRDLHFHQDLVTYHSWLDISKISMVTEIESQEKQLQEYFRSTLRG
jgi:nucleoside-diphosphate-sugar epimerase